MKRTHSTSGRVNRWWTPLAVLVPLALVLIAPALGVIVPSIVLLIVVLWAAALLHWRGEYPVTEPEEGASSPACSTAEGAVMPADDTVKAPRSWVNILLIAATLVTTTAAGAAHQGRNVLEDAGAWIVGLPYGLGLMLVLGVHEMGHYLAARHHRMRATLPYFIPVPFGLGTFGAFIRMTGTVRTRRQLFDVGAAGPLAGLVVAIPALAVGLRWSRVLPSAVDMSGPFGHGVDVHSSVLLAMVSRLAIGDAIATGHYVVLHPLAFAGWLGVMITALNLLPGGQLDGGHIAHALFGGRAADRLGKLALAIMVVLGLLVWHGLLFWALFVFLIGGTRGAQTVDGAAPLDAPRRALAWLSFGLLAVILLPLPHVLAPALGVHCPYV